MNIFYKNLFIASIFFTAFTVHAASQQAELTLSVNPTFPKAGEVFTVEAKSFSTDNARANFQWFLNGKSISNGVGITSQTFTAGKLGSAMGIDVRLTAADGRVFSQNIIIYVADVDLLVRPFTYTPINYRGSPLASVPGATEVYAVPHLYSSTGVRLAPKNLIYEWSLNGQAMRSDSGQGKNKLIFSMSDIGGLRYSIKLKVSDSSGTISTTKTVTMPTMEPQMVFYETNPLLGRFQNANVSFEVRNGENISVLAEPYYFGLGSLAQAIVAWMADGKTFQQPAGKNPLLLEISAPKDSVSITNFSLLVNDKKTIRQRAQGSFNIRATQ